MRHLKKVSMFLLLVLVLAAASVMNPSTTKAGYADNYNRLYYDLSRVVYSAKANNAATLQHEINKDHGANKFKVISTVDANGSPNHPMSVTPSGAPQNLNNDTGFKAMAIVAEGSQKLFIAFSGTDSGWDRVSDINTARVTLSSKVPGQNYQSQLFINYIYETFPKYRSYKWYFTGHSLGGWLATKSYLDIRSANWLIPDKSKFKHGGPIKKSSISGVYTFNPLPIRKTQISSTQWNANKNGTYNADVKNLYIDNEWLNAVYKLNRNELDYIGTKGAITSDKVPHYSAFSYKSSGPLIDIANYYRITRNTKVNEAHGLKSIQRHIKK